MVSSLVGFRLIFWLRLSSFHPLTGDTCLFRLILLGSATRVLFELVYRLTELYGMIVGLSVSEIVIALPHVEPVLNKK